MNSYTEYTERLKEYSQKLEVLGDRNSYSKTDPDATFMRMKEDAMLNGQLKPAYNLQLGVDSGYISWLMLSPRPTDTNTLIPFLTGMEATLRHKYPVVVADAGYESEENYSFLEDHRITAMIKPANYEISRTKKYKADISRKENMPYDPDGDFYTCRNGCRLYACGINERKSFRRRNVSKGSVFQGRSKDSVKSVLSGSPAKKGSSSESTEASRLKVHSRCGKKTDLSGNFSAGVRQMFMQKVY